MADLIYNITDDHFDKIADQIDDNEGRICLELEDGDYSICFKGDYSVRGVYEGDYYNGTGASYYTSVNIYLTCEVYDEDGEVVPNDFECGDLERYILGL